MRYMPSPLEYYLSTKQILAAQGMNVLIHKAKKMLFWSDHNKDIKQIILENSDEFSFFVDAGAKIGDITKAVASNFIKCLCFEPAKKNYQILIQNLAINIQSQNVIPYNFALGSETTTKKFFLSSERNGDNRFFVSSNEKFESYDVQIKKLDDILSSNNINEKIIIKMDVQGAELDIMKGSKKTLEHDCLIITEFWPWGLKINKNEPIEFVDFMKERNYGFYTLENKPVSYEYLQKVCQMGKTRKFVEDDFLIKKNA